MIPQHTTGPRSMPEYEAFRTALDPHQEEPTHPVPVAGLLTPVGVLLVAVVLWPAGTREVVVAAFCFGLLTGFVRLAWRLFPPCRDLAETLIDNNPRSK